jgi:hypothetical protein
MAESKSLDRFVYFDSNLVAFIKGDSIYLPAVYLKETHEAEYPTTFPLDDHFSDLGEGKIYDIIALTDRRLNSRTIGKITKDRLSVGVVEFRDIPARHNVHMDFKLAQDHNVCIVCSLTGYEKAFLAFTDTQLTNSLVNIIYKALSDFIRTEAGMPLLHFEMPPKQVIAFGYEDDWQGFMFNDEVYLPNVFINSLSYETRELFMAKRVHVLKPHIRFNMDLLGFSLEKFGSLWYNHLKLTEDPLDLLLLGIKRCAIAKFDYENNEIIFPKLWKKEVNLVDALCRYYHVIYRPFSGDWLKKAVELMPFRSVHPREYEFTTEPYAVFGSELVVYRPRWEPDFQTKPKGWVFVPGDNLFQLKEGQLLTLPERTPQKIGASISLIERKEMMSWFDESIPLELADIILDYFCDMFVEEFLEKGKTIIDYCGGLSEIEELLQSD